jgi:hypothetical protein
MLGAEPSPQPKPSVPIFKEPLPPVSPLACKYIINFQSPGLFWISVIAVFFLFSSFFYTISSSHYLLLQFMLCLFLIPVRVERSRPIVLSITDDVVNSLRKALSKNDMLLQLRTTLIKSKDDGSGNDVPDLLS